MKKHKYDVIERRPVYSSKEEEQEALNRGALGLIRIAQIYKNQAKEDTA